MRKMNRFENNPKLIILVVLIVLITLLVIIAELFLRVFFPFNLNTMGNRYADKADLYGWAYNPYEVVRIVDPDNDKIILNQANNHGWRDRDRYFENTTNSFRILILGDSMTFGAIVGEEDVYTWILEDSLRSLGYNIEVINIALGGWGTDQQIEALINEGLDYEPNVVIFQFTPNDLTDNVTDPESGLKPFYYELDEKDTLIRRNNPHFSHRSVAGSRDYKQWFRDEIIQRSEILKRLYFLRVRSSYMFWGYGGPFVINEAKVRFLDNIEEFDEVKYRDFIEEYSSIKGEIDEKVLIDMIDKYELDEDSKTKVLRISENHYSTNRVSLTRYYYEEHDIDHYNWRLYKALLQKGLNILNRRDITAHLLNTREKAAFAHRRYWRTIHAGDKYQLNFYSLNDNLKIISDELNIGYVPNDGYYQRARNDGHPNPEGNRAMASDLLSFIIETYGDTLEFYKH